MHLDFPKVLRFSFPVAVVGPMQRKGLLFPAVAKFTGEIFLQWVLSNHERFYWWAVNKTQSRHIKRDLNCFDPNSIELCIFCGLYFNFILLPVFKYKALVGVLSSSIWVLYQGQIFLAAMEQKKNYILFLFLFRFYVFFHGACKPCNDSYVLKLDWIIMKGQAQKHLEIKLTNITRRHFCSLPYFFIEHSFNTLFTFSYRNFVSVFCLFWHTLTARDDARQERK